MVRKGIALLLVMIPVSVWAASGGIVFILDASNSMNQKLEAAETKFEWAQEALTLVLRELPEDTPFAVVAFGHRVSKDLAAESCLDIEILVPYGVHPDRAARDICADGTTLDVVAVGVTSEVAVLLGNLARTCGGRFVLTQDPTELPALFREVAIRWETWPAPVVAGSCSLRTRRSCPPCSGRSPCPSRRYPRPIGVTPWIM